MCTWHGRGYNERIVVEIILHSVKIWCSRFGVVKPRKYFGVVFAALSGYTALKFLESKTLEFKFYI